MKKAQNVVEYALIAIIFAIVCGSVLLAFNMQTIKNYIFMRPATNSGATIDIEEMTRE